MGRFLIIDRAYVHTLSKRISGTGAAIEAQERATKSSSTVPPPSTTNSKQQFVRIGPFSQVYSHIHGCWPLIDDKE